MVLQLSRVLADFVIDVPDASRQHRNVVTVHSRFVEDDVARLEPDEHHPEEPVDWVATGSAGVVEPVVQLPAHVGGLPVFHRPPLVFATPVLPRACSFVPLKIVTNRFRNVRAGVAEKAKGHV